MRGLTLEGYATRKHLPVDFVRSLDIYTVRRNGRSPHVAIPYHDADGDVLFRRYRDATRFWCDRGATMAPYGLDRLARAEPSRAVLLVEGESDAHTAWYHGIVALGVPGAGAWRPWWAPSLAGRTCYVWQEPDQGGERFVAKIAADLDGLEVVRAPKDAEDLSALHQLGPSAFCARLAELVRAAVPAPDREPTSTHVCRLGTRRARSGRSPSVGIARSMPILDVAARLGLGEPKRIGREYAFRCPLHDDTDPSLYVNPDKGAWWCGSCWIGGDGIHLWRLVRRVGFKRAIREMAS